ncbi:JAB domain-containing protein [Bacillus mexicanus]|uniref:JAB domain-containing protein n=1 Tax=Bacillus mexicanus TaxID=2834415 RepID=UPI003D236A43
MKKILDKLNQIYKNEKFEKQYLIFEDEDQNYFYHWISDDVSGDATNSSIEKFEKAVQFYNEKKGSKALIVHNHPDALPNPSLMDYSNARLMRAWSSVFKINVTDYMIFSEYGYYSFQEASEWECVTLRNDEDIDVKTTILDIDDVTFEKIRNKKEEINHLFLNFKEGILLNKKIYISNCLPLEFIKKEIENVCIKNATTVFFSKGKMDENNLEIIKRFLNPNGIIEISPYGEWDIVF